MTKVVRITDKVIKYQENFWNNIHFHPTDAIEDDWGQKILNEVAKDKVADTVRMYAMLEDIVTMDENGKLVYDFTENDVRMDYMINKGFNLLVSYNFIPACIATDPGIASNVNKKATRYKGKMIITSIPKDYGLWEEICYEYTRHIVDRYGLETVSNWYLQCFNEPDVKPFFMSDLPAECEMERCAEYCKLYKGFSDGISRVSTRLTIGGPALAYGFDFLDAWLTYVKENHLKLDYVCGHSYGTSYHLLKDGACPFNAMNNVDKNNKYLAVLKKHFPNGMDLIVDEWGASTHGFFNIEECPALLMRETEKLATYFGKMITFSIENNCCPKKMMICLSGQHEMTVDFSGFRNFFTLNFIKKPIYNAYILMRKLKEGILESYTDIENLSVLPTIDEKDKYSVLLTYASTNFDKELPALKTTLEIEGVTGKRDITIWAIDEDHTNPYAVYIKKGYGPELTDEQIAELREEGNLKPVKQYSCEAEGKLTVDVELSNNGFMVVEF